MAKPNFVPQADWDLVVSLCKPYKVDPYLIAAIGWHETNWGRVGAGVNGWILGYGYYPGSPYKQKYKGLKMQVTGALNQYSAWMQSPLTLTSITNLAVKHWRSSAPRAWAKSVYSIWYSLTKGIQPQPTDTEAQDLSKRVEIVEYAVNLFKELISKLAKEFERER
ncbi:hypothetical protein ES708_20923 [subsurface metagenome]